MCHQKRATGCGGIHSALPSLPSQSPIELRTDHGSLEWLQNFKEPEGQLARWLERLQEFNFTITHRQGRKHGNADAMSRRPCGQCGRESHDNQPNQADVHDPIQSKSIVVATTEGEGSCLPSVSRRDLRQQQLSDPSIGPILKAMDRGRKPSLEELKGEDREAHQLAQLWEQLKLVDGVLHRRYEDSRGSTSHLQMVVPSALRANILHELHGGAIGGHLGAEKTIGRLKERIFWPDHSRDVKQWCQTCAHCVARKAPVQHRRAPMRSVCAGFPMQLVATDIVGPFPESPAGNTYVLVASDYFTQWVEAYAIPDQEATTATSKLVDEMFCQFGIPEQLHSDQGRQFESDLVRDRSVHFVGVCVVDTPMLS